ncbi:alpha/beta-hydrolase [Gloeophyllum trabeum ATCC 11539]|uniref:Alpha/beta-hydrolase n=1 Tax=Gloeophyllum trabeum (strain ATCC 11539 / FP-39264 / Madison 617) TaxID=670483 RepID=S7QLR3_GLOTA|nr:alpha/beta-hydrolase [Gloeophyllum trabeum ATCC 11539]EPQ60377.1 alpha/beta-hydrolase [Gloeophyllum trabeum ATCC 11539]
MAAAHPAGEDTVELNELAPLVIVEGFLGGFGSILKGAFETHLNVDSGPRHRRAIFASVGPVSSLHDRACELYYAIVGGTVDYGEQHARRHKHARYGRTIEKGLYPQWSRERPLHFLGHSMGGPTITKMQWLLKKGHFGNGSSPDMVLSVTAVSAAFRGSPITYTLGSSTRNAPCVRPFSFGSLLAKTIHIFSYLSPILPAPSSFYLLSPFDFHIDSRRSSLTCRHIGVKELIQQIWKSDWAESRDCAPYDVTFEAVDARERLVDGNGEGMPCETTFYQSYATCMTEKVHPDSSMHAPASLLPHLVHPPLYLGAKIIGSFDYSVIRPVPSFFPQSRSEDGEDATSINADILFPAGPGPSGSDSGSEFDIEGGVRSAPHANKQEMGEEYWANDGVVPLFSQWHPHACRYVQFSLVTLRLS